MAWPSRKEKRAKETGACTHSDNNNTDMLNAVSLYTPSCHLLNLPPDSDTTASQLAITMT
jgi:hypothetical protein